MNEIVSPEIQRYAEEHTSVEPPLLKKIGRDTFADVLMPRMLSGHLQGRFLAAISRMIRPRMILEIGTYTGYSALCLLEGLQPGGKLITIDINEELEGRVREYFKDAGVEARVDFRIGKASDIVPGLDGPFDLVWLDADKENYSLYYDQVIDKVHSGGWILADNVLWSGKVIGGDTDKDTLAMRAFNDKVMADAKVRTVMLPVRDGISLIQRI
ncbi:MAG: O-methyltransferase [Bacteroidetes bacterium]|nr:O-methyltransferase [Bacteroidota bacterium]